MVPTLRFSSLVLLAASWMLAAGCGDDETLLLATGGSSGQAGAGAHAGSTGAHAGASGGAGKSGSSAGSDNSAAGSNGATDAGGAAGEGGEPPMSSGGGAGTSGGGTSGGGTGGAAAGGGGATAGTGGIAGGGGATAGTGGTAGGGGATAGTGGTAGGGGTAGTAGTAGIGGAGSGGAANSAVKNCSYSCATDDDCKITNEADQSHFCHPTRKRCEDTSVCRTTADCVGFASVWYGSCQADTDCKYQGDVCVAFSGRGACATPPDSTVGCAVAIGPDSVPTTVARFGSAGNVEVCASPDAVCVNNACLPTCDSQNGSCSATTTCNSATGLCDCSSSGQCNAQSNKPVCGADSHCGCATSDQCVGSASTGLDHCYSGTCGCSSATACPNLHFHNAVAVCE